MIEVSELLNEFQKLSTIEQYRYVEENTEEACRIIWYLLIRLEELKGGKK